MVIKIKRIIQKEKFHPGIIGLFINSNYLIRRPLCINIKKFSLQLNGNLLDFGCGTKPYKSFFKNVNNYTGVDYKIEGREEQQKEVDVFYDGKRIPFENDTFDSVLCTEVLEHVFNIEEVLSELHRVLKNNGKAIITTPFIWEEHEMPYDFARYTTPALIHLYNKNGFEILDHVKTGSAPSVIAQFKLNFLKNILPQNKVLKHLIILPIIFIVNIFGLLLYYVFPKTPSVYFNNIFLIQKQAKSEK